MVTLQPDTISILRGCCSYRAPAIILDPELDLIWQARFESVSQESFTLFLLEKTSNSLKASRYFISFAYNGLCCAFFTGILEYQSDPHSPVSSLTLQLPSKIIGMERRMSHRISIGKKVVPLVYLYTTEGQTLHPKPKNLSLTGIMVEFDSVEDPDLLPPAEVGLELRLGDHAVQLKSLINRRDGHSYFLSFPEVISKDGVNAPQPLQKIVESLERTWIQERVRMAKRQ